jgi:hypothetical protein
MRVGDRRRHNGPDLPGRKARTGAAIARKGATERSRMISRLSRRRAARGGPTSLGVCDSVGRSGLRTATDQGGLDERPRAGGMYHETAASCAYALSRLAGGLLGLPQ